MIKAFQWDLGRQVERLDWMLRQLPRYASWGYTELYLHLEDAVEFPRLPGVARKDAYSRRQLGRLVEAAHRQGIGVVPIVNLLGHTQYLIKVPALRHLNEVVDGDGRPLEKGQVCPLHPDFPRVAEALVRDILPFCSAGKLHAGLDESFSLGCHPLSSAEISRIGLAGHFAGHVRRLEALFRSHGLRLGMWADMLALIPEAVDQLPAGIAAYDWYYYPFSRSPRVELRGFAPCDLEPALRRRGIEYWGCPMNGSFRFEPMPVFGDRLANIRSWWERCQAKRAEGILITSWESNRLAADLPVVVDAAAASLWLNPGADDTTSLLTRGFERVHGKRHAHPRARAYLGADERAYAGYWRWEINERWDTSAVRTGTARFEAERSYYAHLRRQASLTPGSFRPTVAFRLYLAERDVFVRSAAASVLALRHRLRTQGPDDPKLQRGLRALLGHCRDFRTLVRMGAQAARRMWAASRDPRRRGPNAVMVDTDGRRLRDLETWTAACLADPQRLLGSSPVCGAWQLRFDVVLTEPAVQRILVEERRGNEWVAVHGRTLIEFRAPAARPRTKIRREMSVPVSGPEAPLRIALRGIGRASVSHVALTNGTDSLEHVLPRGGIALGEPAPAGGFPALDWTRNTDQVILGPWKAKRRSR